MSVNAISAQGSTVHIGTGTGAAKTITAITKAFRAEVSSTAHGLSIGDRVTFTSVGGMTELNGVVGTILDVGTNVFVVDIDTRLFTTYTSGGTATPVTYTEILEVKGFNPGGASVSDIDVTDLKSTAKEFRPGLVDNGEFSMDINYLSDDPGQSALKTAFEASQVKTFKVTDPEGAIYTFLAYVKNFPAIPTGVVDGVLSGSVTLKISGAVTLS